MLDFVDPALFFAALTGLAIGVFWEKMNGELRRSRWRERKVARGEWVTRGKREPALRLVRPPDLTDPAEQLRIVSEAEYHKKPLLNRGETRVFAAAEEACAEIGKGWRVHAQVALGEVLASPDPDAHRCINAKRVDMLIVTGRGEPLAAIEYQGQGHHKGATAPARDAVKKEALRRAGIRMVEVTHEHGPDDLRRELQRIAHVHGLKRGQTRAA